MLIKIDNINSCKMLLYADDNGFNWFYSGVLVFIKGVFVPSLRTAEISRCHPPLVSSRNNVWGTPRDSAILMTSKICLASDWSCHQGKLLQPIKAATRICIVIFHQYWISAVVQRSFARDPVITSRNIGCFKLRKKRELCSSLKVSWNDRINSDQFPFHHGKGPSPEKTILRQFEGNDSLSLDREGNWQLLNHYIFFE